MREILTIQVGQCGNHIGNKFWEHICVEHGINPITGIYEGTSDLQAQRINVYFKHDCRDKFSARSINVDLDSSTKDTTLNSPIASLFGLNNFVTGNNGSASNNYAKGYCTDGYERMSDVAELMRIEVENCDVLQGFQVLHSLGGGTGTGMCARILEKIREEWPDRVTCTFSIIPSPKISETVVEPYNCILGGSKLISLSDETFCFDNEALYRICTRLTNHEKEKPTYNDLNKLTSLTISGITTCLRFPGQLNSDLRKLAVNTIPFPRLHFFITGFGPLHKVFKSKQDYCVGSTGQTDKFVLDHQNSSTYISDLIIGLFKPDNFMCSCNPEYGKYLTVASFFRGILSTKEIEEGMCKLQEKRSSLFVDWIPSNTQTAVCDIPPNGMKYSGTFVANNTAIRETFLRILDQFDVMLKKRAFLHWYLSEGIEEDEFGKAENDIRDLIGEYSQFGDVYSKTEVPESAMVPNSSHVRNINKHNFTESFLDDDIDSSSLSDISHEISMNHIKL